MAIIAVAPILLTDILLTIGTDSYEMHVSKVQFDPTTPIVKWKGLSPTSVYNLAGSSDWTCTLEFAQDWVTTNSLSQYLMTNAGTVKTGVFKPKKPATGTAPTWTASLIIVPGAIGGAVDTVPVATVTLGVSGVPVMTVA